jgi:hypothetical protein
MLLFLLLAFSWQANAQQQVQLLVDSKPFDHNKTFFTNHTSLALEGIAAEEGLMIEVAVGHSIDKIISKLSFTSLEAFATNAVKLASRSAKKGDIVIVKVMPKNAKASVFILKVNG